MHACIHAYMHIYIFVICAAITKICAYFFLSELDSFMCACTYVCMYAAHVVDDFEVCFKSRRKII